ncbi:uncharacterized protein A1O9_00281 [Exophiala aquamarina CBS 119918]|uniref:Major facilitator superfamily (MFS) profile domain-containing protein n=1 Tax=Exophiala aquamarina CBS 119918 TaxID=1182545 RepID=A0A072PQF7_9EURO|nr:uncharacterized protein A1O9_00281 [Exophiala aquamarina CBS 119918]KEF62309.1 hypothetical protein A1O9_00281 [Exophiala aquamarina CBS 119918]
MKNEFDAEKADGIPSNASRAPTNEERIHEPVPGEPLEQTSSQAPPATTFLTKTLSRVRTRDSIDPGPPPDGGFQAWFQACLGHLVIFNSWGYINSFGLFQTYYVNVMQIGGESSVAWIGTTQVFVLFGIGTFSGRGLDAGYFRIQFILGSIIYVTGMFLTSLCTQYYQIFLAQSICVGIGLGLCFVPTLALRSMGLAIAVTGSTTGGLVFPAIAESMLPSAGFPWAMRAMGFVQMALAIVTAIFLKPRLPPRKSGPLVEWAAFRETPYTLYCLGTFLYYWSVYVGFFFVGSFGRNVLGTSQSTSINLLMVLNGVGIVGRTVPNYVAQKWTGPLNLMLPCVAVAFIVLYCWIAVDSVAGLWVFTIVYGFAAHALQALYPVVLTSLTSDQKKAGVRAGMGFTIAGFAVLTGPPIAGALVQQAQGSYLGLQLFSATSMLASALVFASVRWSVGWRPTKV